MRGGCLSAAADAASLFNHLLASSSAASIPQIAGLRFLCCGDFASSGGRLVCLPKNPTCPLASSSQFQVELEPTLEGHSQLLADQDNSRTVRIKIQLHKECRFGEHLFVVGAPSELGSWNPLDAVPMTWSDGHVWTAELDIHVPLGEPVQFKFILREISGELSWQPGEDRVLHTWETSNAISVFEDWENVEAQQVTEEQDINLKEGNNLVVQAYETSDSAHSVSCLNDGKVAIVADNTIHHTNLPDIDRPSEGKISGRINATNEVAISGIGFITSDDVLGNKEVPIVVPGLNPCATTKTKDVMEKEEQVKAEPDISNIGGNKRPEEPELDEKKEQVKGQSTQEAATIRLTDNRGHAPMAAEHPNKLAANTNEDVNDSPDQDLDPWHNDIKWGHSNLKSFLNNLGFL